MKKGLLLYKDSDYEINRLFADRFIKNCCRYGLKIDLVLESGLKYGIRYGNIFAQYNKTEITAENFDFAINRTRNAFISYVFEYFGIKVFNSAAVTALCNDKNLAYLYAAKLGVPCLNTYIIATEVLDKADIGFPVVIKKPFSHGGRNVYLCNERKDVESITKRVLSEYVSLQQKLPGDAVNDIRVYIMGNQIIGAVKRRANEGIKANYCRGGSISLYDIDDELNNLVNRFLESEKYDFVGIDFLYNGKYFFNEIEDAVGSRSLCILKNIDTSSKYLEYISNELNKV